MKDCFVTYDIAVKLKEKGFREFVCGHYKSPAHLSVCNEPMNINASACGEYTAPRIDQALKWIREKKYFHIEFVSTAYGYNYIICDVPEDGGTDRHYSHTAYEGPNDGGAFDSYEEAALAAVEYILDNLLDATGLNIYNP